MFGTLTQKNNDDPPRPSSPQPLQSQQCSHYSHHTHPCQRQEQRMNSEHSSNKGVSRRRHHPSPIVTSPSSTISSRNQHDRGQKRISSTFGGPGSAAGSVQNFYSSHGSGSESPSSSTSSPYSSYSYSAATPSPTTSARRLTPLLESSSTSHMFAPTANTFRLSMPLFDNQSTILSSSSPMPSQQTTMTNLEETTVRKTTEPYYFPLARPMHPLDSLPSTPSAQAPIAKAHKISTFGIGPILGPIPASPSIHHCTDGVNEDIDVEGNAEYSCGSNNGISGGNASSRRMCGCGSTRNDSIHEDDKKWSSPTVRPKGGGARSTFGYEDHYPISPTSPLALSAVPSPTESMTEILSTQQQQQDRQQQLDDQQYHALQPPLPLSSSVHPPRIITTALYIPSLRHHASSALSTSTTAPSGYHSHASLSPLSPSSPSSSLSLPSPLSASDRGSHYSQHLARNERSNLLFPPLGLGLRLGRGDNDASQNDRSKSDQQTSERNAISPTSSSSSSSTPYPYSSPSSLSLPRSITPHLSPLANPLLSQRSRATGTTTPIDPLQIDHLRYYQLGRRNSARSHVISFDDHFSSSSIANNRIDESSISYSSKNDDRFMSDDSTTTTPTTTTASVSLPRSSTTSRSKKRLSAFAKRIFTRSPTPSSSSTSVASMAAITPESYTTIQQNCNLIQPQTVTAAAHDISKPIIKYPFRHSNDIHRPQNSNTYSRHDFNDNYNDDNDKNDNVDIDDDDNNYEDEIEEDIHLYTLTHHPTTFVPSHSVLSLPAVSDAGTLTGPIPASASSLTPTFNPSRLPIVPSQESLTVSATASTTAFENQYPQMRQWLDPLGYKKDDLGAGINAVEEQISLSTHHGPLNSTKVSWNESEEGHAKSAGAAAAIAATPKKKCSSFAIFRFFLKK